MLRPTLLMISMSLLAACSSPSDLPAGTGTGTGNTAPADNAIAHDTTLVANHWLLTDATDKNGARHDALFAQPEKPVQVDFVEGRVVITGGCNTLSGSYTIEGNTLTFGPMISTLMACPPALAALETTIKNTLDGPLVIDSLTDQALTVTTPNGDVLVYRSEPTAATRYGSQGETVFWEIAAQTQPCSHGVIEGAQCLQVREVQFDDNGIKQGTPGGFTHFYGTIEGYEHQPGTYNVLRLKRYPIANPPADGSSEAYVLDLVVESGTP